MRPLTEKHFQTLENAMIEAKERKVASNRPGPKLFSGYGSTVVEVVVSVTLVSGIDKSWGTDACLVRTYKI